MMGDGSRVGEIDIDFVDGVISGNCDGCTALDVADALERLARFLRTWQPTGYANFDEGALSSANARE